MMDSKRRLANFLPVSQQKSRHSRCSSRCSAEATHERASGSKAHAHAKPHAVAPSAHPPWSANHPGIMQKPGIPAQQMQRTDSRERACGSGTGQNPLAEHV